MFKNCLPILINIHIPETARVKFAQRINTYCVANVQEARHRQKIKEENIYISCSNTYLKVATPYCIFEDSEDVNRHKLSVDFLFNTLENLANNI